MRRFSFFTVCSFLFSSPLLFAAALVLVGCSSGPRPELPPLPETFSVDLFAARGFLGGSDYEHYVLKNHVLWRECGAVQPKKKPQSPGAIDGDSVLQKDPSLTIEERRVERLTPEAEQLLVKRALELWAQRRAGKDSKDSLPSPGSVSALSAPGLFELTLQIDSGKEHFVTSVDAISDAKNPVLLAAYVLFAELRGVGPRICKSETFFGVGRNSADRHLKPEKTESAKK